MLHQLLTYLENAKKPVSSIELARHVFKLETVSPDMAEKLVSSALRETDRVVRHDDGTWSVQQIYHPIPESANDIVLCQIVPGRVAHWRNIVVIYCARLFKAEKIVIPLHQALKDDASVEAAARTFLSFASRLPVLFDGFGNQLSACRRFLLETVGHDVDNPVFLLNRIVKQLFPEHPCRSVEDCARVLGGDVLKDAEPGLRFESFVEQVKSAWYQLEQKDIKTIDELSDWYSPTLHAADFSRFHFDKEFIEALPARPGVYVMRDRQNNVIYVGKAMQLRRRVSSYFAGIEKPDAKLKCIRERLYDLEIIQTGSELEALLLEQELIEKHSPPLNTQVEIAPRISRQQQRYPRILVLPSFEKTAQIYCINKGKSAACAVDHVRGKDIHDMLEHIFFTKHENSGQDKREEIITSWLTQHADEVQSIDMRLVSTVEEAKRLIQDHINSLHSDYQNIVHI